MFAYLSLLIEKGYFDEIRVNFLIVGHTHTTIDQYFSVITKKLFGKVVLSPLSLQNLFNTCQNPLINRQIFSHYDYRTWLSPIINEVHFYQLPHVFVFKRRCGRAVCQHKPYTRSPRLFPVEPDNVPQSSKELAKLSRPLRVDRLSFIGGVEAIQDALEIDTKINTIDITNQQGLLQRLQALNDIIEPLKQIELKVSCETGNQMLLQSEKGYLSTLVTSDDDVVDKVNENSILSDSDEDLDEEFVDNIKRKSTEKLSPAPVTKDQLNHFAKEMEKFNSNEKGYLLWLNFDNVNDTWLTDSSPTLFDHSLDVGLIF